MTDEQRDSIIVLRLGDPKTWALFAALIGAQGIVGKLSVAGVESQQQHVADTATRAVEKQESIDDRLRDLRSAQDQMLGEVRFRLDAVEKRMRELPDSIETTTKKGR